MGSHTHCPQKIQHSGDLRKPSERRLGIALVRFPTLYKHHRNPRKGEPIQKKRTPTLHIHRLWEWSLWSRTIGVFFFLACVRGLFAPREMGVDKRPLREFPKTNRTNETRVCFCTSQTNILWTIKNRLHSPKYTHPIQQVRILSPGNERE